MAKLFVYGVNARCPKENLEAEFGRYYSQMASLEDTLKACYY